MKYLVTGTISTQFEVEVEADSVLEARDEAYYQVTESYGKFENFDIYDIYDITEDE